MNIKMALIEKERIAYIENNPSLAKFFADTLDYIAELEERVNAADAEADIEHSKFEALKEAVTQVIKDAK